MQLRFTQHARERMLERNVTEDEVHATVAMSESAKNTPQRSRRFERILGDKTLRVWVVWPPQAKDRFLVKTVAWKGEDNGWD